EKIKPDQTAASATMTKPSAKPPPAPTLALSWSEEEIENRFGFFRAGRYTTVNKTLSFLIALILTALFYLLNSVVLNYVPAAHRFAIIFVRPGNAYTIGPALVLFLWAMTALFIKSRKLEFQRRALSLAAVPQP